MTQSDGDTAANDTPKPGFLQRINPFRHPTTPVATPAPQPEATPNDIPPATDQTSRGIPSPRYNYVWPPKPVEGNLAEAERFFARAAQAQSDHRSKDAVALYREATEADPAFFEAEANLGLAAYESGDLTQSLLAYETALAIRPDSFSARFKFGLALGKAGYIQDAAQELERALAAHPEETAAHLAMAHLALANLYADQFHQPAYARPHYQKVLELDPDNSQTSAIQFWLRANP
jgi:tetratricopeptide (TPR) repeat protein